MAKDRINSIILGEQGFEWSVVTSAARGHGRVADSGFVAFPDPAEGTEVPLTDPPTLAARVAAAPLPFKGAAALGVGTSHVLSKVMRLPHADPEEMAAMAELQADKFSPFPVETLVVSHEILQSGEEEDLVLICAVHQSVLEKARAALEPAGIRIHRVDATILGWWQLLQQSGRVPDAGRHIFVLLVEPVVQLIGIDNGVPVVFRALISGPRDTEEALIEDIHQEVDYTLMSMEMEHGPRAGHGVTVWHDGDAPESLLSALQDALGTAVQTEDLSVMGRAADGVAHRSSRPQDRLNMTPKAWRSEDKSNQFKRRLLGIAGAVLLLWLLVVGGLAGSLAYQRRELTSLTGQRDLWNQQAMEVRELRRRVVTIQAYTNQSHSALECLREIAALQTSGVELSSMTYHKGEGLRLSGSAVAVSLVYDFKKKLDESALFLSTELERARLDPKTKRQLFDMTVNLPGGES